MFPPNHPLKPLSSALELHHEPAPCETTDQPPHRRVNIRGRPRRVLPTIVSFPDSYANVPSGSQPGPAQVFNIHTRLWETPTIQEKERLLGFDTDDTDGGPSVSLARRHYMIGQAIHRDVIRWFAGILAFQHPPLPR